MSAARVFISYSHDSDEHRERVRHCTRAFPATAMIASSTLTRTPMRTGHCGSRQLKEADFILCVITETYAQRFGDREFPNIGLGSGSEAGLIRRLLYDPQRRICYYAAWPCAAGRGKHRR